MAARGIEYLFANGGTDFAPVVEAYAKGQKLGWRLPQIVIVPHENMGVAMAHGYAMVTGKPQAMMVHVGVGTANSINGLINASRQNIPILFTAGRTPITESGALPAARNNYIHWAQEHFDQGGMLREFMKWDYELRHAEQVETVIDRALAIAKSEPQGPVYVTLPREILASDFPIRNIPDKTTIAPASPPAADPEALEEAAKLAGSAAHSPLLITANGGRTAETSQRDRAARAGDGGAGHPLPAALPGAVDRAPDALRLGPARAAESRRRGAGGRLRRALDPEGRPAQARREGHPHRPRSALRALSAARLPHRYRADRRGRRRRCRRCWRSAQKHGGLAEADRGSAQDVSQIYPKRSGKRPRRSRRRCRERSPASGSRRA